MCQGWAGSLGTPLLMQLQREGTEGLCLQEVWRALSGQGEELGQL